MRPTGRSVLGSVSLLGALCRIGLAQGVTGASIDARVIRADQPDSGLAASLVLTDARTGLRAERASGPTGRVVFENLTPGGPYTLEAHAVGYQPSSVESLRLVLGQRLEVVLPLSSEAVRLAEISVTADPLLSPERTGASFTVSDTAVRRLPLLNRDFVDLIQTAPDVAGTSIAGTNNRYNNILIDGGVDNDFFGLSRGTGAPGGQIGVRSLPLEAVREFQVLTAPFDVRQGNFTGGEINAVTRAGTNTVHGSLLTYYQGEGISGKDTTGARPADFSNWQYGATVSGPIVRNRVQFFVTGELRRRSAPFTGPTIAPGANVGISVDSATRFQSILRGYGLEPGSFGSFTTRNRSGNLFAKLSGAAGRLGLIEGSLNYAEGEIVDTMAPPRAINGDYRLTSATFEPSSTQWSGRIRWTSPSGSRLANEFIGAYLHVSEPRQRSVSYPAVFVGGVGDPGFGGARLVAGADPSSQRLTLVQRGFELTDNARLDLGPHAVTIGGHAEFLHFAFSSFASAIGQYQFTNLAAFEAGTPSRFTRNIALRPGGAEADFGVTNLSFYLQDRWELTDRLTVTPGLRMDLPRFNDRPVPNDSLLASPLAVNTGTFIETKPLWGPRLGFNWAVARATTVRGGAGLFSGRMAYSWASFAYTLTGNDAVLLNCAGAAAPAFVPDPEAQPSQCPTPSAPTAASVSYFDPSFRLPQTLKFALGADRLLPWGVVASIDGLYEFGYHQLYITDDNLTGPVGSLAGEGGRVMYGTIGATTVSGALPTVTPSKVTNAFGPVLRNSSRNGGRTYVVTAQVRKRFTGWIEANAAYSYTDAKDVLSLRDAQTVSNYGFVPVVGTLADRGLATSVFSIPHKVTVSGTVNLPAGLAFSLIYIGRSGLPFTYVVNGDANGDGVGNRAGTFDRQLDDPIYVPRDASDIAVVRDSVTGSGTTALVSDPAGAATLQSVIDDEACLRKARGTLLSRNSCRNRWQHILNARLAEQVRLWRGQSVELMIDVFNLPNLIDGGWGLVRETGSFASAGTENVPLLKLRGQDAAAGRNLYEVTVPARNAINIEASRWRIQFGARYAF